MRSSDSARVVQVTLMGVLVGIGLPIAIASASASPTLGLVLACAGYVIQALNFFHGKIATLDDLDYARALRAQPRLSLADYVLNMGVVVHFVVIATLLTAPAAAAFANTSMRLVDLVLVLMARRIAFSELVRRAQWSWAVFDMASIGVWMALGLWSLNVDSATAMTVFGGVYLVIAIADIVMDYTYNRELYFRPPNSWAHFASGWDAMQGELGDEYRQEMIVPALKESLRRARASHVLDVGCGNGCVARGVLTRGRTIRAIDSSREMVSIAESYDGQQGIGYDCVDVRSGGVLGSFDAALSVFSHQDVGDLDAFFAFARGNLRAGGLLLLVYEDLDELERDPVHSTSNRRWLDRRARADGGRRQFVYWHTADSATTETVTVTTCWSPRSYPAPAGRHGFELREDRVLVPRRLTSPLLRMYSIRPRLRLAVFRAQGEPL